MNEFCGLTTRGKVALFRIRDQPVDETAHDLRLGHGRDDLAVELIGVEALTQDRRRQVVKHGATMIGIPIQAIANDSVSHYRFLVGVTTWITLPCPCAGPCYCSSPR